MYNLKMTIISLPKIIGCDDFPKDDHGNLLVDDIENFINNNYRFTAKQVNEAFDMAATHSLYMDGKRVNPSTFGKYLSRASVGQVLTAYRETKQSGNARPSGYNLRQLNEADIKKITPEEAYSLILKWTKEDGEFPMVAPYRSCYLYLLEKKAVREIVPKKSSGRFSQMIGAVMDNNPYRMVVQEYLTKNL